MTAAPTALALPPLDPLPPAAQRYFAICAEKLGLVPNVLLAHAFDVEKLNAFTAMYNGLILAPSGLTKPEREMVAIVVSAENRCFYCLVAHGAAVRQLSGDPELGEMIAMNYRMTPLEPRLRAMLDFAVLVTNASRRIVEVDRRALRDHGLSERDIFDLASVAAFFNMSNRLASALAMVPNPEYHGQARG